MTSLFIGGVETKLPPGLVAPGQLLVAQNCAMRKQGRVEKRWGFAPIITKPLQTSCNWNGQLGVGTPGSTALGSELLISGSLGSGKGFAQSGWSPATNSWIQKGTVQPTAATTKTAFAGTVDCQGTDLALNFNTPVAGGCYGCYAYQEVTSTGSNVHFCVVDDKTGQNVMDDTLLCAGGFDPRVVAIGPYFCVFVVANLPFGGGTNSTLQVYTINPIQRTVSVPFTIAATSPDSVVYDARAVTNAPSTIGNNGMYVAVGAGFTGGNLLYAGFNPWTQGFVVGPTSISSDHIESIALGVFSNAVGLIYNVTAGASPQQIKLTWLSLSGTSPSTHTLDSNTSPAVTFGKATLQSDGSWRYLPSFLGNVGAAGHFW